MNVSDSSFKGANSIMPARNAHETARFYKDRLGFTIGVLWEKPNYACVNRGGVFIEFGEGRPAHVGSGVCYIHVDDVDAVYEELKARGASFVDAPEDRDYGSRDFRVRDNDGNLLIFGRRSRHPCLPRH
jgi:uncharacterized glyoxalase superfamily protein PhnB